jgi:hypothetical protein
MLGISKENRASGEVKSKAVLDWLEKKDREETILHWVFTIGTIALSIGALVASGGTAGRSSPSRERRPAWGRRSGSSTEPPPPTPRPRAGRSASRW